MRLRPRYDVREWFREDIRHEDAGHRALWEQWFTDHGVDPSEVLLTEWVERRAYTDPRTGKSQNQIVWLERHVDGHTVHREINLPRPPAPFPVA